MFGVKKIQRQIGCFSDLMYEPLGVGLEVPSLWSYIGYLRNRIYQLESSGRITPHDLDGLRKLLRRSFGCTTCWDEGGGNRNGTKRCPDCGRLYVQPKKGCRNNKE